MVALSPRPRIVRPLTATSHGRPLTRRHIVAALTRRHIVALSPRRHMVARSHDVTWSPAHTASYRRRAHVTRCSIAPRDPAGDALHLHPHDLPLVVRVHRALRRVQGHAVRSRVAVALRPRLPADQHPHPRHHPRRSRLRGAHPRQPARRRCARAAPPHAKNRHREREKKQNAKPQTAASLQGSNPPPVGAGLHQ
eukprot:3813811-Prymnesium_polylepis.3